MSEFEIKRLYQKIAADLKAQLVSGKYKVGERLPSERVIGETMEVSRTVVREAIIMLEIEGFVEVRKGSGIHVIATDMPSNNQSADKASETLLFSGPFELLQARQLLESNIAEFAASQVTKQDIIELKKIQAKALKEDRLRDSKWDKLFHIQIAKATQNSVLLIMVEQLWEHREQNPYWLKLHEHIDESCLNSWCCDHEQILDALIRKDPQAAKLAMWQHLENTKQMLFNATIFDGDDRYLFTDNPVVEFQPLNIGLA
ncbi:MULTISPECIES: transcriptional regulator ExuR [unclassified Agarivorans]|uniref:transcriptional regulator ExuR n=1 Tax=unclassified Agarivorans TaxID=2636026 RepID=UPI003D7CDDA1